MRFANPLGCLSDRKFIAALLLFPLSFLLVFYSSMCLFISGFNLELSYVALNFLLFFLLTLVALFLPGWTALYLVLLYFFLLAPTLVAASYIATYGQPMHGQSLFFIWETNLYEIVEFAKNALAQSPNMFFFPVIALVLPLLPMGYLLHKRKQVKAITLRHRAILMLVSFGVLLTLCVSGAARSNMAYQFYHSFFSYHRDVILAHNLSNNASERIKKIPVSSSRPSDIKETYVVVIGESASRHHMSLYGYDRETDTQMKRLKEHGSLVPFDNVNAIGGGTSKSLINGLSFKDQFTPFNSSFRFSAIDVFNAAGFETYWLSNNAVMLFYDTLLQSLSRNATVRRYTEPRDSDLLSLIANKSEGLIERNREKKSEKNFTFDDALLPWFDEALNAKSRKKIIFVHLKGSHSIYWYRFPNAFEKFKGHEGISPKPFKLADEDIKMINDYDNSIHYTDAILSELIQKLEATEGESWLLYFSDHGDEVFDFRHKAGRDSKDINRYILDVPFMVWFSKEYSKVRNTAVMGEYADRPFDLDSLIYAVMDLANIKTDLLDETRSIFSDKYKVPARMIIAEPYFNIPPQGMNNPRTLSAEIKAVEEFFIQKSLE